MGEVVPRKKGTEETALAKNRRVDFHIVHRYSELDVLPEYPEDIRLPWSGQPAKVRTPEDIARKMAEDEQRRRTERNIEGPGQDDEVTPVPVPAVEDEEPEPVRIDESDEEAAPEDPAEDPAETEE